MRGSELSVFACAAATGLGMAAAGGRITFDLVARFGGAVGENIAVPRELQFACEKAFAAAALRTGFICPHKIHMPTAAMMSKPTIMNRIAPSPS